MMKLLPWRRVPKWKDSIAITSAAAGAQWTILPNQNNYFFPQEYHTLCHSFLQKNLFESTTRIPSMNCIIVQVSYSN